MTQCEPELLLSLAQLLVRLFMMTFVSIGAILSINWGWRLYRDCIVSRTSGELQSQSIKLKFSAAGPGVLLAAFGAWLLSLVATHQFSVETTTPTKPTAHIVAGRFIKAQANATGTTSTVAANSKGAKECERCAIRHFRSHQMDGDSWEPSSQDILNAVDAAISTFRSSPASQGSDTTQTIRSLRTLSYLRDMSALETRQDSAQKTESQSK